MISFGELGLDRLQLTDERVVVGVGDRRLVVDEVAAVVLLDLVAQRRDPRIDLGWHRHAMQTTGGV